MKNSALYAGRVKKAILADAPPAARPEVPDAIRLMIQAILEENASVKQAEGAMKMVEAEFVDYNELRVAPVKDVVDGLGRSFPGAREKAIALTGSLHAVFEHCNALLMEYLAEKPKREVRKILREQLGLSRYAEAVLTLAAFGGHAVPVDQLLLEALKLDELIHSHSDLADLQGFLEGIVPAKDGYSAHVALRAYAARNAPKVEKELQRRRKIQEEADAKARAKEEARLKVEAVAKAKAEAEAKAKAEAEAAAKAQAEAKAKAERRAAAKAKRKAQAAGKKTRKTKPARASKPAAESVPAGQAAPKTPERKRTKKT